MTAAASTGSENNTMDIEHRLRNDIVSGELPFGSRLRIEELAARYGVSNMPVREALRTLNGEGLVVIEPNRGARVRPIYRGFIEDMFDVRAAIETLLARRAAERRTDEHLVRLQEAERDLEACVNDKRFEAVPEANRAFHSGVNAAAGNPGALDIVDKHWHLVSALLKRYTQEEAGFQRVIDEHRLIVRAIEQKDPYAAGLLMGAHIERGKQSMMARAAENDSIRLVSG